MQAYARNKPSKLVTKKNISVGFQSLKCLCFKGQHQESENSQDENILLYYILENGFVSNKYSLQLNNKKITQLFKMGFLKKHFPKEDIKTSNKHMKR